jgi:hypothetical protein
MLYAPAEVAEHFANERLKFSLIKPCHVISSPMARSCQGKRKLRMTHQ